MKYMNQSIDAIDEHNWCPYLLTSITKSAYAMILIKLGLKHGEYRFVIKNGKICAHKTIVSSVVEVEEKEANNASENKEPINESAE